VKHVAQQNYDFFSKVGRTKPDVGVDAIANLKTKDGSAASSGFLSSMVILYDLGAHTDESKALGCGWS
jgi:hypothetical protein